MIVRKIREEEYRRTEELFHIAFEFQSEFLNEPADEMLQRMIHSPKNRFERYFRERWAAFEDDDKTMMGYIIGTPYDVEFDGNRVKMSGVGGVASLAQYRRHGVIRGCFHQYLKEIYEEGFLFSALFPFSTAYYRQFGYEIGGDIVSYNIGIPDLPKYPAGGSVHLVEKGAYLDEIKKVYADFRRGINLMTDREDFDYDWVLNANPVKDGRYIYLYRNEAGEPKGVMAFFKEPFADASGPRGCFHMNCSHFFFTDKEGFQGLMNLCHSFSSYYQYVSFRLPSAIRVEYYIPEWTHKARIILSLEGNGMVRAVNVKRVLELAKYKGDGELIIRVRDHILTENNKTYRTVFRDGRAESVTECSGKPDADLDIQDFSRMILGVLDPQEFLFFDKAKLFDSLDKIGKVFYKKPIYIAEQF